jgi:hypothetical protein
MVDDCDRDHGWLFSYMHIDGPNLGEVVHQQRLNRINEDDEGYQVPEDDGDDIEVVEPPSDRNNRGPTNRERFYDVTDSLNMAKLNSFEVNKIFRTPPLNHGGILEPFFGVRYIKFEDVYQDQDYWTYDEDGLSPLWPPPRPWTIPIAVTDAEIEDLFTDRYLFQNQMLAGQLGIRWLKRTSRWNLSAEFRAFAAQNWQHLNRTYTVERTYYDGPGQGSEVDYIANYKETHDWHATATVVGTDIRALAAYEVTRDIKLEVGMQFLGFFTGIGRGPDINLNSDEVVMVGTTFGFVVNK